MEKEKKQAQIKRSKSKEQTSKSSPCSGHTSLPNSPQRQHTTTIRPQLSPSYSAPSIQHMERQAQAREDLPAPCLPSRQQQASQHPNCCLPRAREKANTRPAKRAHKRRLPTAPFSTTLGRFSRHHVHAASHRHSSGPRSSSRIEVIDVCPGLSPLVSARHEIIAGPPSFPASLAPTVVAMCVPGPPSARTRKRPLVGHPHHRPSWPFSSR